MDDKGQIVGSADVDENLALQVWTKDHAPRLVIFNKVKNTKKLIHFSWVEKRDRKLNIKGAKRGETISYSVEDFGPALRRIFIKYARSENGKFLQKLREFVVDFDKVVHSPELISNKKELAMLSEDKRSSLWVADCTGEDKTVGVFRPFFPFNEQEAEAVTEERLSFGPDGRSADALLKTGAVSLLKKANPTRWHNPVRLMAAAMLLGFSFCEEDGSEFGNSLWEMKREDETPSQNVGGPKMKHPVRLATFSLHAPGLMQLGHKLVAYIRHFDTAGETESWESMDSTKELEELGYARTRRFDFQEKTIGDVPYRVTLYENKEKERMALSCEPRAATARHKGDLVYTFPMASYKRALKEDTMSATEDDFYTMTQLIWARQFRIWYDNVAPYIGRIIGLV
ncbi:MAG: hypothetical protein K6E38_03785 [Fretibacterium sp.]|nr:hypothetical protein [Fretibacterium sp.]